MGDKEQKLTIRADALGFEDAAKKVDKVAAAQADLKSKTEELNAELGDRTLFERTKDLTIEFGKLAMAIFWSLKGLRFLLGGNTATAMSRLTLGTKNLAMGFAKVTLAMLGSLGVMRYLAAGAAVMAAGREILRTLREEIALRLRLVEIMGLQSEAADEIKNKQLAQKATLEDMARRIRKGGFGSPDVARTVQSGAESAKKQFTQLKEENINLAFAAFGGIEGTSQRDLVDLAIIAQIKPGGLQVGEGRSTPSLQRERDRLLRQFRGSGQIDEFARTETVQGQGTGRGEFRPTVTERAQEAIAEGRSVGGAKGALRALLKELLPADFAKKLEGEESSREDLAVMLYEMFGSAEGVEGAKVGVFTDLRPLTTLINMIRDQVEIALEDQPGFGAQALGGLGLTKDFATLRAGDYEEILKALRTIDRATVINNYNYQNAKFVGPDADTRRGRTRNGRTLTLSREGV